MGSQGVLLSCGQALGAQFWLENWSVTIFHRALRCFHNPKQLNCYRTHQICQCTGHVIYTLKVIFYYYYEVVLLCSLGWSETRDSPASTPPECWSYVHVPQCWLDVWCLKSFKILLVWGMEEACHSTWGLEVRRQLVAVCSLHCESCGDHLKSSLGVK